MTIEEFFKQYPEVAVAFSGGTDSAYLLYLAGKYALQTTAIYVNTPFQPAFELEDARRFCAEFNIPITVIEYDVLQEEQIAANPANRCYYCKTALFTQIVKTAAEMGFPCVADGTNASDTSDDRPGMRALAELEILSPLRLCGITKEQIREESRGLGLFTADKPSYACLATRIPAGTVITAEALKEVEQAESALAEMGFVDFRVRRLTNAAKLEITKDQFALVLEKQEDILHTLLPIFGNVYLDLKNR